MIDIVTIAYRSEPYIKRLYEDLPKLTTHRYRVYIWDNLGHQRNLSSAKNDLAREGSGEFLFFANPDVLYTPGWDAKLITFLREHGDEFGAVIPLPVGDRRFEHVWKDFVSPERLPAQGFPTVGELTEISASLSPPEPFCRYDTHYFCLWFGAMMKRATWEKMKGFDERLRFLGADREFQQRMGRALGLGTAGLRTCALYHAGGASVGEAEKQKELRLKAEWDHRHKIFGDLEEKKIPLWHEMSDQERAQIRKAPEYARIPEWR
jgi:GT2 family glycosyltransferase